VRNTLLAAVVLLVGPLALEAAPPARNIVGLQPARRSETVLLQDTAGRRGNLVLVSLNPAVNAWFLLTLQSPTSATAATYHIETSDPQKQRLALDPLRPGQLVITGDGTTTSCTLWPGKALDQARRTPLAYAPVCEGRLFLRNAVKGNRTTLEATTEFLRDHVWRGEQIVGFVRREFYRDAFIERAVPRASDDVPPGSPRDAPPAASMHDRQLAAAVVPEGLGIDLGPSNGAVRLGRWYATPGLAGVFVSVAQPRAMAPPANARASSWKALDAVEHDALDYFVAFDLAQFELGFALGTDHPRLGWSARVPQDRRDAGWPGPDGIADAAPVVRTGMLSPALQSRVVATFTGGFKREHGAFRFGALAISRHGSHYGFIEQGVVFSTLVPGLSTLYVQDDGTIDMKTWRSEDDRLLPRVRHARQNGVPLLEPGADGAPAIGALVDQWGAGNWSGSADERLRTLRAGACVIDDAGRRFLVYGYFSAATPRAMAQVFQAYGCRDAMHLDMNALEHTYLALYRRNGGRIGVEHLVQGMAVLDKSVGNALVPRFLGFADDRDFFYLVRRRDAR
jgi:hypothetical protein